LVCTDLKVRGYVKVRGIFAMLFMVIERVKHGDASQIGERFRRDGSCRS
jgi:hypothetical protein